MKTGFIAIGHPDYAGELALAKTKEAVNAMQNSGIDVLFDELIHTDIKSAGQAAASLLKEKTSSVILFPATWVECPAVMAAVTEIAHLPFALWGMGMFDHEGKKESTGSFVSLAMLTGAFKKMEYPHEVFVGNPDDSKTIREILAFTKAAAVKYALKRSLVGLVGYSSMGIYTGMFDAPMLRKKLGPEILQTDSYTIVAMMERVSSEEVEKAKAELYDKASVDQEVTDESLEKSLRMYCALKKWSKGYDAINVKCQYEFSKELGMTACVPLSMLAGIGLVTSCEGDIPCTVSMLVLKLLSGKIPAYGDALDISDGIVKFSPCGIIPYELGAGEKKVRNFMPGYGFKGIQNSFVFKEGPITYLRIAEELDGYHFIYGTGSGLPTELRQGYMPALDVKLDISPEKFVNALAGQHYAFVYGDYSKELSILEKLI
jgi:L-fucose isomerase-like protein